MANYIISANTNPDRQIRTNTSGLTKSIKTLLDEGYESVTVMPEVGDLDRNHPIFKIGQIEYLNDIIKLNRDAVEKYCDRVNANDGERHHLLLKVDAAYDWAHFIRDVYDFSPLRRFVRPGTFYS